MKQSFEHPSNQSCFVIIACTFSPNAVYCRTRAENIGFDWIAVPWRRDGWIGCLLVAIRDDATPRSRGALWRIADWEYCCYLYDAREDT